LHALLPRRISGSRFDVRGMGDSEGAARSFESIERDIGAAVDCLQRRMPGTERVVLWGLCDGASAALLYWHTTQDVRVSGLSLLNPWVRSEASLALPMSSTTTPDACSSGRFGASS
jgi:alpha-beta hydrolase superfamily lysophospholipase